jgi:hypothetical protein
MKLNVTRVGDWAAAGDRMAADANAPNPSFILSRRSIKGMGLSKAPVILLVLGSLDPLAKPEVNAYG